MVSTYETDGGDLMLKYKQDGVSADELEMQHVETLPDRAAMSLVNANLAIPINLALAANVLSDGAIAAANAQQATPIDQGMLSPATP
jgi:hypothetical protein